MKFAPFGVEVELPPWKGPKPIPIKILVVSVTRGFERNQMSPDPAEIQKVIEPVVVRLVRKVIDKGLASTVVTGALTWVGLSPAKAIAAGIVIGVAASYLLSLLVDKAAHALGLMKAA